MTDPSDPFSFAGEWSRMKDNLSVVVKENEELERENKILKDENVKMEELVDVQDKLMREVIKRKEIEITNLKAQLAKPQISSSTEPLMGIKMDVMRRSSAELQDKIIELRQIICEKRRYKASTASGYVKMQLTGEIESLERLCEQVSQDIKNTNEYNSSKIQRHLRQQIPMVDSTSIFTRQSHTDATIKIDFSLLDAEIDEQESQREILTTDDYAIDNVDVRDRERCR